MSEFSGYKWIKVKHFKFDPSKTYEENYKALDAHHVEETTFLIDKVREVAERQDPEKLAALVVDALVEASLVSQNLSDRAIEIAAEEINARMSLAAGSSLVVEVKNGKTVLRDETGKIIGMQG